MVPPLSSIPHGGSYAAQEQDELARQFDEYYKMQAKMNQMTIDAQRSGARNSSHIAGSSAIQGSYQPAMAPPSGFTKNSNSGNIISHDIVDVRP
jgi:hypothetical protein